MPNLKKLNSKKKNIVVDVKLYNDCSERAQYSSYYNRMVTFVPHGASIEHGKTKNVVSKVVSLSKLPVFHSEDLRGADEVGRGELHVDGGARRVQRATKLIAHRQHLHDTRTRQ